MATVSYASTLPQAGDPQLSLLGRIAQAISSAVTSLAAIAVNAATGPTLYTETAWLASAARTATQNQVLTVPAGAVGIILRLYITAIPGVDTVSLAITDGLVSRGIITGGASATAQNCFLLCKTGGSVGVPASASTPTCGLGEKINIQVAHSAATSFTYSATYCWLMK